MKVQKGILPNSNRPVWIVLDDDYLPVEPIQKYLHYLDSVGRSPNTIQTYAHNLKLFWEFLRSSKLDWLEIDLEQLSNFIYWLRNPSKSVLSIEPIVSKRCEKTINHCVTTVCGFYEFQERIGATVGVDTYRYQLQFKKNVQARALEHGYCARPKVLGDCNIPGFDGCYNCPHWRTNKNFIGILKDTLERTNNVLEKAQNCGWQLQVHKNTLIKENLEKVIKTLEADND